MTNKPNKKYELEDVQYHKIDEFPDDFDPKSVYEDLNTCDKCGIIVVWHNEMFWQGDCYESYHWCMLKEFNKEDDYTALCDDCFYKLPSLCHRNNKETSLNKETQAKMMEYIKNNSAKSLKEVIKKFIKNTYLPCPPYFL